MLARVLFCALLLLAVLGMVSSSTHARGPHADIHAPDWDLACYSTYAQIDTFLHDKAAQYPQIATLTDAGVAWEGIRHIWALTLGSSLHPGPKPSLFLVAGQHPRDIATTEMLLRLISYLTLSYGSDPDVTWLLDNRSIVIIPSANPRRLLSGPRQHMLDTIA
jgi:hypothetical protein